jgi:hypothetical protein
MMIGVNFLSFIHIINCVPLLARQQCGTAENRSTACGQAVAQHNYFCIPA